MDRFVVVAVVVIVVVVTLLTAGSGTKGVDVEERWFLVYTSVALVLLVLLRVLFGVFAFVVVVVASVDGTVSSDVLMVTVVVDAVQESAVAEVGVGVSVPLQIQPVVHGEVGRTRIAEEGWMGLGVAVGQVLKPGA